MIDVDETHTWTHSVLLKRNHFLVQQWDERIQRNRLLFIIGGVVPSWYRAVSRNPCSSKPSGLRLHNNLSLWRLPFICRVPKRGEEGFFNNGNENVEYHIRPQQNERVQIYLRNKGSKRNQIMESINNSISIKQGKQGNEWIRYTGKSYRFRTKKCNSKHRISQKDRGHTQ